jgi:hypothetical protein
MIVPRLTKDIRLDPFEVVISKSAPCSDLYSHLSDKLKVPLNSLKVEFNHAKLFPEKAPKDVQLGEGDLVTVWDMHHRKELLLVNTLDSQHVDIQLKLNPECPESVLTSVTQDLTHYGWNLTAIPPLGYHLHSTLLSLFPLFDQIHPRLPLETIELNRKNTFTVPRECFTDAMALILERMGLEPREFSDAVHHWDLMQRSTKPRIAIRRLPDGEFVRPVTFDIDTSPAPPPSNILKMYFVFQPVTWTIFHPATCSESSLKSRGIVPLPRGPSDVIEWCGHHLP